MKLAQEIKEKYFKNKNEDKMNDREKLLSEQIEVITRHIIDNARRGKEKSRFVLEGLLPEVINHFECQDFGVRVSEDVLEIILPL